MPFKLLNLGRTLLCIVPNDAYLLALSSGTNNSKTQTYDLFPCDRRNCYFVSFRLLSDLLFSTADAGIPTSVDFVHSDTNHMVAAYNNQAAYIFDMETAKPIVNFEYASDTGLCFLILSGLFFLYIVSIFYII